MFTCLLSAVTQAYAMFTSVETYIESSCCKFLRRVNTRLEIDMWSGVWLMMMMLHEHGRTTVMTMCQFTHDGESCKQGSTNLRTYIGVCSWYILHIYFIEDV